MTLLLRLADINGPFVDQSAPVRNWSSFPFHQLDRPDPPYLDIVRFRQGIERARRYLALVQDQGYTGIAIDNLAHLVTFDQAPHQYYEPDSPYRLRALAYRTEIMPLLVDAAARGMQVYVTSDMQWLTSELRQVVGRLSADNPLLYELNRNALIDLFTALPMVSGVIIRIGETGGAHDHGGYSGHLLYHNVATVRRLIDTLLAVCTTFDRQLIVRTWTLGIGEVGDLLWSPERYTAVFASYHSPHLFVSIKHTPADFFRLLPPNPTIGLPGPRQIIEVQNRREYELFGMVPAGVVELHSAVIRRAEATRTCIGLWAWNSTGGWGGGKASIGPDGWNIWTEASSALTGMLARHAECDGVAFAREWFAQRLAHYRPEFGEAVADAYISSERLLEQGWYFGHAPGMKRVGGLVLPPLLWVWWMRPTAALPVWVYLAEVLRDALPILQQSARAVQAAQQLLAQVSRLAPGDDPLAQMICNSLSYLVDALIIAWRTRALLLPLGQMAFNRQRTSLTDEVAALRQAIYEHQVHWANQPDFPPLELDELERFLDQWDRAPQIVFAKAQLAARLIQVAHQQSCRPLRSAALMNLLLPSPIRRHIVQTFVPWLSRRLDLLPSIFFETGPALGEWAR
jgi:hypothetical protein